MDEVREKLIELLEDDECPLLYVLGENVGSLADYLIANGVTIQRWIPVTERLPKEEDADIAGCVLAIERSDGFARRWEMDAVQRSPEYFTQWMPLPQAPGKDGG